MSTNNRDDLRPPQGLFNAFKEFEKVDVVSELSKLREEIKSLREALNPPKSALIVGSDVERILKELK